MLFANTPPSSCKIDCLLYGLYEFVKGGDALKDIKTVGQLIEALKKYPVDMPIGIETDSYTTKVSEPIVATHSLSNRIRGARTVSGPLTAIYQGGPNQYLSEETAEAMHKMDQGEGIELLTKPVLLLVGEEPYEQ